MMVGILIFRATKSEAALELNNLYFDVQINEDGSMDVKENWNIDISDTNTLFKTFIKDSSKYSEITNVKVKELTNGKNKEFEKIEKLMHHVTKDCYYGLENSDGLFEIAWGVGLDNSSDTRQYEISYTVEDAVAKYNDYSELYWQFIGENFEIDAKKIVGTITLPKNANTKEDIRVWGHTEDLNGEIYVTELNQIKFVINNYSSGNYVEIRSLIPNDMISGTNRTYNYDILNSVLEEETKWADEANERREFQNKIRDIVTIIVLIFIIFFVYKIIKNLIKVHKMEKKIKPLNELQYFRELPYEDATPAEALFVITTGMNKSFTSSFSANILDLCLKKYLSLEVIKSKNITKSDIVKMTILEKDDINLKSDQKLVLDFLKEVAFRKSKRKENSDNCNEITTEDIEKYLQKRYTKITELNNKLEEILEKEEIQKGNFIKENEKMKDKFIGSSVLYMAVMFFAIPIVIYMAQFSKGLIGIGLIAVLIINSIILGIMAYKTNVFSQKGVDEKQQWKAFKKYMEDFSLLKDKEVPALVVWEKYLVFATVFGISEKVLKQLKVIYPEMLDANSAIYTYSYIHIMNSVNIGDCINNSVYSAVGSSGSGAGGGFSGGGGGGRRPEAEEAGANLVPVLLLPFWGLARLGAVNLVPVLFLPFSSWPACLAGFGHFVNLVPVLFFHFL